MFNSTDTIAALSTPAGESGIAVIRMSGPQALDVLSQVVNRPDGGPFTEPWEHRRLYHAGFMDDAGDRVDDVMVAVMRAPETYTGDHMVEISGHGGTAVVRRILDVLFTHVRPAQPGEFTRRAFLNGKMDLIQAEAVADLIHARTEVQRVAAEKQLAGELSRRIDRLADDMLMLLGDLEARIDFIEEGIEGLDIPDTLGRIARQRTDLDELLETAPMSRLLHDGIRVVIAGPVNAGKSSLFNRLLGESRAIVTEIAGTTRDVLRETIVIDGVPFVLHDTAGLRETSDDRIEVLGMGRTSDAIGQADLILFVLDGSAPGPPDPATRSALAALDADHSIVLINKADISSGGDPGAGGIRVSAQTGAGLDELRSAMTTLSGSARLAGMARERAMLNIRLAGLLEEARTELAILARMVRDQEPLELIAHKARQVLSQYEEATGRRYHDGLLDTIFSRFCIGK
ncbi:MAG TPA: tRNA uridine-5-carboxymethylaminomethyl(34) synthesis GTPase MnmE [Candidatus Krumholzibacteria bacterium]|nr:tRNA uridine-5-carboxymethylaminomethyl(34) synthesis GTPase MnmE [Candidatus Krumholzibacteria bacterium]